MALLGPGFASLAVTWLLFYQILGWRGTLGFLVCWYGLFLIFVAGVTAIGNPRTVVFDRMATAWMYAGAIVVGFALTTVLIYTFWKGLDALKHWNFYHEDMAGVRPTDSLDKGGILHAMVGSFIMVGIATLVALPLGVGTAVYITEVGIKRRAMGPHCGRSHDRTSRHPGRPIHLRHAHHRAWAGVGPASRPRWRWPS